MTYTEAAVEVLRLVGRPLHYKKIAQLAVERGLLSHVGKSPEITMSQRLAALLRKDRGDAPIVKVKPGVFGLKEFSKEVLEAAREGDVHSMEIELPAPSEEDVVVEGGAEEVGGEPVEEPIPTPSLPGVDSFPEEEDDDEPLLGRPSAPPEPTEGDGEEASRGKKKRRRRRRKSKEREEATTEASVEPRPASERLPSAARPMADTLADAIEEVLQAGPKHIRSFLDIARELVQRGRLEGSPRALAPTVAAAVRGDDARRRASARRVRFRVTPQGVRLVAWDVPGDAMRAEREARRLAARQRRKVREELLRRLDALPAEGFVELVASWLCAEGVSSIRGLLPPTGASGYHLAGQLSRGGLEARLAVWVLRGTPVTRQEVISLRGALHHYGPASVGWIVTTGRVESDARDEASMPGAAPVALVDGAGLAEALERAGIGVHRVQLPLAVLDAELLEQLGGGRVSKQNGRAEARRETALGRAGDSDGQGGVPSELDEETSTGGSRRRRRRRRRSGDDASTSDAAAEAASVAEASSQEGPGDAEEGAAREGADERTEGDVSEATRSEPEEAATVPDGGAVAAPGVEAGESLRDDPLPSSSSSKETTAFGTEAAEEATSPESSGS